MYPFVKLAATLWRARRGTRLNIDERSVLRLRAGFTDVDLFGELNHARHLTCMELGRWDYSLRTGFVALMKQKKWGLTVGGASIRYRRRIPLLHRFTLTTELLCHDERWFYFLQETHRDGRICSSALVKAGATSKAGLVPATEVAAAMGRADWNPPMPGWVSAWIEAESRRPWPPG